MRKQFLLQVKFHSLFVNGFAVTVSIMFSLKVHHKNSFQTPVTNCFLENNFKIVPSFHVSIILGNSSTDKRFPPTFSVYFIQSALCNFYHYINIR